MQTTIQQLKLHPDDPRRAHICNNTFNLSCVSIQEHIQEFFTSLSIIPICDPLLSSFPAKDTYTHLRF